MEYKNIISWINFRNLLLFCSFLLVKQELRAQGVEKTRINEKEKDLVQRFENPIMAPGADPWVLQVGDTYYYTHTNGNRLELWETDEMHRLGSATKLKVWTPPKGENYSHHIWAPELHFLDGKWYLYFAATYGDNPKSVDENRRMFVLENSSESPMNTAWEFKGQVTDTLDRWAIDGTVFENEGERYFIWSGWRTTDQKKNSGRQQIYIARMKNPWTLEGTRVMISEPEFEWERNGLVNEGPVIWKNPLGEVFLFFSSSGCWTDDYNIGVMKLHSDADPLDPGSWEKHSSPVFKKSPSDNVYAPGHNSFFKSPDGSEDWIVYHANSNPGEGCGGKRTVRIQKMAWDEKGFPSFGTPAPLESTIEVPRSLAE